MLSIIWTGCACALLVASLIVISLAGDSLINYESRYFAINQTSRCVADSLTHALIGVISWAFITFPWEKDNLYWTALEIIIAGIFATIIDLDHFIESRSWNLEAALSLQRRPFLHNTSLIIIIFIVMLVISRTTSNVFVRTVPFIFLISSLTHHLRDGNRRGIWFWSFETMPLSQYTYITFIIAVDLVMKFVLWYFSKGQSKQNINTLEV